MTSEKTFISPIFYLSPPDSKVIPNMWKWKSGEELFKIVSGYPPSKMEFKNDGDVLFIKVNDLNFLHMGKYLCNSKLRIDKNNGLKYYNKGTIVFPKRGAAILTNKIAILGVSAIFDKNIMGIIVNPNCATEYIYYMLKYISLPALSDNLGIPQINNKHVYSLPLPLPSLPEQHKIASVLSKVDEQISLTEAIIGKTEELKRGMMQQLLTKGIGHTKFKKTEIEEIPEEWEVMPLPHVFNVIDYRGRTPPFSDNGIPYIGADNIRNETIVFSNRRYVSYETYEKYMTRGIPNAGDILFSTEAPLGKVALVPNYKFCFAQRLVVFQRKDDKDSTFFVYCLKSTSVQKQFIYWSTGTTVKGISVKNLRFIKLCFPKDVAEQKKIGIILSKIDFQITQNQNYLSKLKELKQGIMQDLLAGKIRLVV